MRLLSALNTLAEGGGFKIVEEADILRLVPANAEEIARRMAYLEDRQFIDLRYAEAGEYCVRVLAAGRVCVAAADREKGEKVRFSRKIFLCAMLGSFAGGLLAGTVAFLIALAV